MVEGHRLGLLLFKPTAPPHQAHGTRSTDGALHFPPVAELSACRKAIMQDDVLCGSEAKLPITMEHTADSLRNNLQVRSKNTAWKSHLRNC